ARLRPQRVDRPLPLRRHQPLRPGGRGDGLHAVTPRPGDLLRRREDRRRSDDGRGLQSLPPSAAAAPAVLNVAVAPATSGTPKASGSAASTVTSTVVPAGHPEAAAGAR